MLATHCSMPGAQRLKVHLSMHMCIYIYIYIIYIYYIQRPRAQSSCRPVTMQSWLTSPSTKGSYQGFPYGRVKREKALRSAERPVQTIEYLNRKLTEKELKAGGLQLRSGIVFGQVVTKNMGKCSYINGWMHAWFIKKWFAPSRAGLLQAL